jgi:outer membrane lipoprotein-sorting protein
MKKYGSIIWLKKFFRRCSLNGIALLIVFLTLTFCGLMTSNADENNGQNIISLVQQKYKAVTSVEADFVQTNYIASLNQTREFRGKIFLKKPNLFNMEVSQPAKQRQTFDGAYLVV